VHSAAGRDRWTLNCCWQPLNGLPCVREAGALIEDLGDRAQDPDGQCDLQRMGRPRVYEDGEGQHLEGVQFPSSESPITSLPIPPHSALQFDALGRATVGRRKAIDLTLSSVSAAADSLARAG